LSFFVVLALAIFMSPALPPAEFLLSTSERRRNVSVRNICKRQLKLHRRRLMPFAPQFQQHFRQPMSHSVRMMNAHVATDTVSAVLEARRMRYRINRTPTSKQPLNERWRMINRARSRTRARGDHALRVVEQLRGFVKVRYRGLAKNLAQRRPCSHWPTSTKFADNCFQQRPGVRGEESSDNESTLSRPLPRNSSRKRGSLNQIVMTASANCSRTSACAELP
jgi:hypothetical protein